MEASLVFRVEESSLKGDLEDVADCASRQTGEEKFATSYLVDIESGEDVER